MEHLQSGLLRSENLSLLLPVVHLPLTYETGLRVLAPKVFSTI